MFISQTTINEFENFAKLKGFDVVRLRVFNEKERYAPVLQAMFEGWLGSKNFYEFGTLPKAKEVKHPIEERMEHLKLLNEPLLLTDMIED